MRIGINTGLVVTGAVGPGGYTVTGDAVNVAARLKRQPIRARFWLATLHAVSRGGHSAGVNGKSLRSRDAGRRSSATSAENAIVTPLRLVPDAERHPVCRKNRTHRAVTLCVGGCGWRFWSRAAADWRIWHRQDTAPCALVRGGAPGASACALYAGGYAATHLRAADATFTVVGGQPVCVSFAIR